MLSDNKIREQLGLSADVPIVTAEDVKTIITTNKNGGRDCTVFVPPIRVKPKKG